MRNNLYYLHLKNNQIFPTLIILALLFSLCIMVSYVPVIHAENSVTSYQAIVFLDEVVGLDVTMYDDVSNVQKDSVLLSLPHKEVDFRFLSSKSGLRVKCSFLNDRLHQIYLSDYIGLPQLKQPNLNVLEMAKGFLKRYQEYSQDSFYSTLESMLNYASVNKNITEINGNIKLDVSISNQNIDMIWTYVNENGIPAITKNVILTFENGKLQCFMDNWQFYKVVGVPKLSSQEATIIALDALQDFSWATNLGEDLKNSKVVSIGNTTLCFLNYKETDLARSSDPLVLYPSWCIPLGFDKVYPGGVTGVIVRVWADTGKVSTIEPMIYGVDSISYISSIDLAVTQDSMMLFCFAITIVGFPVCGYFCISRFSSSLHHLRKSYSILFALLLCLLFFSMAVLTVIPNANASSQKADIYASTYGQTAGELLYASNAASYIQSYFQTAGYDVTNDYGYYTTRNNTLSNAYNDERNYVGVTVFHFGHMAGPNRLYDSTGTEEGIIEAYNASNLPDVFTVTDGYMDKHYFVWLWACNTANSGSDTGGMPFAWTHRSFYNQGGDGYLYPDNSTDCFIGFNGASPALGFRSFYLSTALGYTFLVNFYDYVLTKLTLFTMH